MWPIAHWVSEFFAPKRNATASLLFGDGMDQKTVIRSLRRKIADHRLELVAAAKQIGVGVAALSRHLDGQYVRSDSLAKYRRWLFDAVSPDQARKQEAPSGLSRSSTGSASFLSRTPFDNRPDSGWTTSPEHFSKISAIGSRRPGKPLRVIDLFSGCGGLSLGFELSNGGGAFRTILAIDIEEPMLRVFNANHQTGNGVAIGRQVDLTDFLNEAEVLAFYLNHVSSVEQDTQLRRRLGELEPHGLDEFIKRISHCDRLFLEELTEIRCSDSYQLAYTKVPKTSLSQTSVIGFHNALKLPRPALSTAKVTPATIWSGLGVGADLHAARTTSPKILQQARRDANALWQRELRKLKNRANGVGAGQLASAARKIADCVNFIDSAAYTAVKSAWTAWYSTRQALRREYFEDPFLLQQLKTIYQDYRADVLLGGPPCQGFSRIGRGKIRSLREQQVHVQSDSETGDQRNQLLHQYILFVSALAPSAFLFENVRHFQAEVKTPEGTFKATDVLAEAIQNISADGIEYQIGSKIISASNHLVPQKRERYFMIGVRADISKASSIPDCAAWCLSLPSGEPVTLKWALAGLPQPQYVSGSPDDMGMQWKTATAQTVEPTEGSIGAYRAWIRQPASATRGSPLGEVDGHCTRASRADDAAFFELLGPGKRWMDYRADGSAILRDLRAVLDSAINGSSSSINAKGFDRTRLKELRSAVDGSLPIRLLLEGIRLPAGEIQHHLATETYLRKREGNHGDWLSRLDSEAPSKTIVSHMAKDAYAYIHPTLPRTLSAREAARIQSFPDWFQLGSVGLVDAYRIIGNAVPPLLSAQFAERILALVEPLDEAKDFALTACAGST